MENALHEIEQSDGIRMTWNVLPVTQSDDYSLPIPIACLYTPLQKTELVDSDPIYCKSCRSILNPYNNINYENKSFICIFCNKNNLFPQNYSDINEDLLPTECLISTIEYLTAEMNESPTFIFLVDSCAYDQLRFEILLKGIKETFKNLPNDSKICLITFGKNINLIDLKTQKRIFLFSGEKEYLNSEVFFKNEFFKKNLKNIFITKDEIRNIIFSYNKNIDSSIDSNIDENKNNLKNGEIREEDFFLRCIKKDTFSPDEKFMQKRCTGSAISFAISLLEQNHSDNGTKIFLFTEGPVTTGPGQVCKTFDTLRSSTNITEGKHDNKIRKFYQKQAQRLVNLNGSFDILCCVMIDIGIYEMQDLVNQTGGSIIMAQDFDENVFVSSCAKHTRNVIEKNNEEEKHNENDKYNDVDKFNDVDGLSEGLGSISLNTDRNTENGYDTGNTGNDYDTENIENNYDTNTNYNENRGDSKYLKMVFGAKFKILTKNITFKDGLGLGAPLKRDKKIIGWQSGCLNESSNISFIFDQQIKSENEIAYFQIILQYIRSDKKLITRVTTVARSYGKFSKFKLGFDQEASLVFLARKLTFNLELENDKDLIRRIDRNFIRFIKRYSEQKNNLKLCPSMSLFPNFIFFLRRSLIIQTFMQSPDETVYFRYLVCKEIVQNAITFILPTLQSISLEEDFHPVSMDTKSLQKDNILLLDTFHNVLIWYGEHIQSWIEKEYHLKEEYKFLKDMIDMVHNYANILIKNRMPTPQFTVTHREHSQERILLSRVNPSIKKGLVLTENIDYETFYESVCKILAQD